MATAKTATWTGAVPTRAEATVAHGLRPTIVVCVLIFALSLGAGIWIYHDDTATGTSHGRTHDSSTTTQTSGAEAYKLPILKVVACTAVGGIGILALMAAVFKAAKDSWDTGFKSAEREWRKTVATLELQLADSRDAHDSKAAEHAQLQHRHNELSRVAAETQAELDKVRKVEKNLSQQRSVLESSKTVLELHVEARTKDLQILRRRYEMILNAAGEGICGFDIHGKTTFVNPAVARMTGWKVEELVGKEAAEIFHGNKPISEAGAREAGECVFFRQDGSPYPVEFVRTQISHNEDGLGTVLIFKDISKRRQTENTLAQKASELARSNAELEQFAFSASHDLQEPLRKIQAFGDRLKLKCDGVVSGEALDYLERMQSAAARMRRLIDDLLAFSRVIRSSEPFVAVDLNTVLKEVIGDLEVRIEKCQAQLETGPLPVLEGDATQMRQLFQNLLSNALKFQPPGQLPRIKVSARQYEREILDENKKMRVAQFSEISVQDNGIGFDEKYLDKVFAVFQRLHGRTEYEGTGVGLAVCRRIAERHGGDITARSTPGAGATFLVCLPLHQPKTPPTA